MEPLHYTSGADTLLVEPLHYTSGAATKTKRWRDPTSSVFPSPLYVFLQCKLYFSGGSPPNWGRIHGASYIDTRPYIVVHLNGIFNSVFSLFVSLVALIELYHLYLTNKI